MFRRLRLEGWRQFGSIDIEFHSRLTIITGANGAGKSTLLNLISRHFGFNKQFLAAPAKGREGTGFVAGLASLVGLISWFKSERKSDPNATKIGAIDYNNGSTASILINNNVSVVYDIMLNGQIPVDGIHIDSHRPPTHYRNIQSISVSKPDKNQFLNSVRSEFQQFFSGHSHQQFNSIYQIKSALILSSLFGYGNNTMEPDEELKSILHDFESRIRDVLPEAMGFVRFKFRMPEVILETKSGDFLIDAVSGGIAKILEVTWQVFLCSRNYTKFVVTIDELENHLHPALQRSFVPKLLNAFPSMQLIIATHSPFIVSSVRESNIYVMRYVDHDNIALEDQESASLQAPSVGVRVSSEILKDFNKAGTAADILRGVLGVPTSIPDWAEDRTNEIVGQFIGKPITDDLLRQMYEALRVEGLAHDYNSALLTLTKQS